MLDADIQGVVDFLAVQWRSLGVAEIAGGY
jgi:hypothetical protein